MIYIVLLMTVATVIASSTTNNDGKLQCDKEPNCFNGGGQPTMTDQIWKRFADKNIISARIKTVKLALST